MLEQCFFTMHSNAPLLKCRISLGWSGVRPDLLPCSRSLNDTDVAGSITTLGVEKSQRHGEDLFQKSPKLIMLAHSFAN